MVVSSLLLAVTAMAKILYKETTFSRINKQSQIAFFAANAGIECALYWEVSHGSGVSAFATTSEGAPRTINCSDVNMTEGQTIPTGETQATSTLTRIGNGGDLNPTSSFGFRLNSGANSSLSCAIVTVTKNTDMTTHIFSHGYNTCDTTDPNRVERGIEAKY